MSENGDHQIRKAQLDRAARSLHIDDLRTLVRALEVASTEDPDVQRSLIATELHGQFEKRLKGRA